MKMTNVAVALVAAILIAPAANAQISYDHERAGIRAERAIQAYRDQQYQRAMEIDDENLAKAMVHLHICKPMHDQTALTRRQYIASVVKGRGKQRAVARECAEQEVWYFSICKPRTGMRPDYTEYTMIEPSCPERWAEWPEFHDMLNYDAKLAEVLRLYQ